MVTADDFARDNITGKIIGAAMEVHRRLGPGFLESVYEEALAYEFEICNLAFERQKKINVFYRDRNIKVFICDFLVANEIIVELKAVKQITEIDRLQVINYLKANKYEVGLLFNFGGKSLDFKRLMDDNP